MHAFCMEQKVLDTFVNNYSDERFKYTLRMNRNTFNYILENIREGSSENYSNYSCN